MRSVSLYLPKISLFQCSNLSQVSLLLSHCTCAAMTACNDNSRIVLVVIPDCSASRRSVVKLFTYNRDRLQTSALRIRSPRVLQGGADHPSEQLIIYKVARTGYQSLFSPFYKYFCLPNVKLVFLVHGRQPVPCLSE